MIGDPEVLDDTSYASSLEPSPLDELRAWLDEVQTATGTRPGKLRIGPDAWQAIQQDPEACNWRLNGKLTAHFVARLLKLEEVELL